MLRVRDTETVRELKYDPGIQETLDRIIKSNVTDQTKKSVIRKLTDGSPCCVCGSIPKYEITYRLEDITRIERYCDACAKRVYEREAVI